MTGRRIAVVGGGIIGAAVAHRLLEVEPAAPMVVLEQRLGEHRNGRNSGVVHAGLCTARPGRSRRTAGRMSPRATWAG